MAYAITTSSRQSKNSFFHGHTLNTWAFFKINGTQFIGVP